MKRAGWLESMSHCEGAERHGMEPGVDSFQVSLVDFRGNTRPDRLDRQHHAEIALLADQHALHACQRPICDPYALANCKKGVRLKLANIYSAAKGFDFVVWQRPRLTPGAHYGHYAGHTEEGCLLSCSHE